MGPAAVVLAVTEEPGCHRGTGQLGPTGFVGLTDGLSSLGPIGIVAGPLVVALLLEVLALLAEERPASG